ncbi:DUF1062 domain-containing protein [Tenuibacillus multivorans]|uniref:DUF1062 domain-containing protein n=1 Tax=Tenuibacillus multivorans TaxID=237069 RepID=UPI001FE05A36|nr:DUF1062 domain-containing protein [Tenuibacillus multivorans]
MNANQKIVDIWLIYNCLHCEETWNYPIISRVNVNKIDSLEHQKFMNNDLETIWQYAFQINQLRKLCHDVNTDIRYELRKDMLDSTSDGITIKIRCKYDFGLRVDKFIAEIFNISRSKVNKMVQDDMFLLNPDISVKKKIIDDLQVTVIGDWYKAML